MADATMTRSEERRELAKRLYASSTDVSAALAVEQANELLDALDHADHDGKVDAIWTKRDTLSTLAESISQSLDAANAQRATTAQAEATALLIDAMNQGCSHEPNGWLSSNGVGVWDDIGEWLVTHMGWQRDRYSPGNPFRPPQAKEEA